MLCVVPGSVYRSCKVYGYSTVYSDFAVVIWRCASPDPSFVASCVDGRFTPPSLNMSTVDGSDEKRHKSASVSLSKPRSSATNATFYGRSRSDASGANDCPISALNMISIHV